MSENKSQKYRNFLLKLHLDAKDSPDEKTKVVFSGAIRTAAEDKEICDALGAYVVAINNAGCLPSTHKGYHLLQFFFRDLNTGASVPLCVATFDEKHSYEEIRALILRGVPGYDSDKETRGAEQAYIKKWMEELGTDISKIPLPDLRELCARANKFFEYEFSERQKTAYVQKVRKALMRQRGRDLKKNGDKSAVVRSQSDKSAVVTRSKKKAIDGASKGRTVKGVARKSAKRARNSKNGD